jgi:hypothetical protein
MQNCQCKSSRLFPKLTHRCPFIWLLYYVGKLHNSICDWQNPLRELQSIEILPWLSWKERLKHSRSLVAKIHYFKISSSSDTPWRFFPLALFFSLFAFKCTWKIHQLDDYKTLFTQVIFHFFTSFSFCFWYVNNKNFMLKNLLWMSRFRVVKGKRKGIKSWKSRGDFSLRFKWLQTSKGIPKCEKCCAKCSISKSMDLNYRAVFREIVKHSRLEIHQTSETNMRQRF